MPAIQNIISETEFKITQEDRGSRHIGKVSYDECVMLQQGIRPPETTRKSSNPYLYHINDDGKVDEINIPVDTKRCDKGDILHDIRLTERKTTLIARLRAKLHAKHHH